MDKKTIVGKKRPWSRPDGCGKSITGLLAFYFSKLNSVHLMKFLILFRLLLVLSLTGTQHDDKSNLVGSNIVESNMVSADVCNVADFTNTGFILEEHTELNIAASIIKKVQVNEDWNATYCLSKSKEDNDLYIEVSEVPVITKEEQSYLIISTRQWVLKRQSERPLNILVKSKTIDRFRKSKNSLANPIPNEPSFMNNLTKIQI